MLRKTIPVPAAPRLYDPAKDAARLLGWFGMAILMVGAPLVGVLSRGALFILLPVGVALLLAGYLLAVSTEGLRRLREGLGEPFGMTAATLGLWMGLSLVWTPFPEIALPRFAAIVITALIAMAVVAHMPERRPRATFLYLLPAGVGVTAALTLAMALFGPASLRGGTEFDPSPLERSILTLVVLVWPALGALVAFGRWRWACGLAVLVAGVLALASAKIAMAAFAIGAVAFALALTTPRGVARTAAIVFGALVVIAPLLPFALAPLAAAVPMVGKSTVAAMHDWRALVSTDALRLVTGHGLDVTRLGVIRGFLPPHTPRTILFEVWEDLGAPGALALAASLVLGFRAAGETAPAVAPALLAGIAATLTVAIAGVATVQLWFVTVASLQAIAFGLLGHSSRGGRPAVSAAPQGRIEAASLVVRPPIA